MIAKDRVVDMAELLFLTESKRSALLKKGNAKAANRAFERIDELFAEVIQLKMELPVYEYLIGKDVPEVTLMISTKMMIYGHSGAEDELIRLASTDLGLSGFFAQIFLDEWRKGNITLMKRPDMP